MTDGISGLGKKYTEKVFQNKPEDMIDPEIAGQDLSQEISGTLGRVSDEMHGSGMHAVDNTFWTNDGDENVALTEDAWSNIFDCLESKGVDISDEDQALLYDIIDSNGDGILTADEYSFLMYKGGITGFSLWNALSYNEDDYEAVVNANKETIYDGGIDSSEFSPEILNILGEDSPIAIQIKNADGGMVKIDKNSIPDTIGEDKLNDILGELVATETQGEFDSLYASLKLVLSENDLKYIEENYDKFEDENEGGNIGIGSGATKKIAGMTIITDKNAEGYDEKYIGIKNSDGTPATDNQLKMAKYLCEELGLVVLDDQFEEFVLSLPPNESEDPKVNNTFLIKLASTFSEGSKISQKDMDAYLESISDVTTSTETGKTITGETLQTMADDLALYEEDTARESLGNLLNSEFNLGLTDEEMKAFVPEGKTAAEYFAELIEDGSLTETEVKARVDQLRANSDKE